MLICDQAPMDRFLAGDTTALSADAQAGMNIFTGKGGCESCHEGAAFTDATVSEIARKGLSDGASDTGFHNVGARPTATDPGIGGARPFLRPPTIAPLHGHLGAPRSRALQHPTSVDALACVADS